MVAAVLHQQRLEVLDVAMPERQHGGARKTRAGPQTRMRQLVDQHEVVAADQRRDDPGIGEVARPEHDRRLGALEPGEPALELAEERVIAGDQAGGATADTVALRRLDRGSLDRRMMGQPQIVVAAEREQPPAVAVDPDAVEPVGLGQHAMQARALEVAELACCEFFQ
jgi:hypothetical protein